MAVAKRWLAAILAFTCAGAVRADGDFAACVATLQQRARAEGISAQVVDGALAKVQQLPKVIALDRKQPEFTTTLATYLSRRVTEQRVAKGRELLAQYRDFLDQLTRRYGVPPQYLLAFWGLETNYGGYIGRMPVLDSLATLACDPRRSDYFANQLIDALHIIDADGVEPTAMVGSWAGAVGQTQFMPSVYRKYAVDADGDGRIDLWHSAEDALASAANFLSGLGWQRELRWGREVRLPKGFAYSEAGLDKRHPLAYWRKLDVRRADGGPLPHADVAAALIVPAGHRGPAFLVYHNFDVIMRWNRSQSYAIAVGYLADRITGGGTLHRPPPADEKPLSIEQIKELQASLNAAGFDCGEPDGVTGPSTREAIRQFQKQRGMIADGYPDDGVLEALGLVHRG